jgi:hypothetical protein
MLLARIALFPIKSHFIETRGRERSLPFRDSRGGRPAVVRQPPGRMCYWTLHRRVADGRSRNTVAGIAPSEDQVSPRQSIEKKRISGSRPAEFTGSRMACP